MKRNYLPLMAALTLSLSVFASHDHDHEGDVRFYPKGYEAYHPEYQNTLRAQSGWQAFVAKHGSWFSMFNEHNKLPHTAFGEPIDMGTSSIEAAAELFIKDIETMYETTFPGLVLDNVLGQGVQTAVFKQFHNGLEFINSKATVTFTSEGKINKFGLDIHPAISLSTTPSIAEGAAVQNGTAGLQTAVTKVVHYGLGVLPLPGPKEYDYRLVYVFDLETEPVNGIPGNYQTFVDANSGELLYRRNKVCNALDVHVESNVQSGSPDLFGTNLGVMANMEVEVGGTTYNTDQNGDVSIPGTAPATATFNLKGLWSTVNDASGNTPSFTGTINPGPNNISFDNNSLLQERSAYFHVNIVHDTMKNYFPLFTGLDFSLPTNVDLSGTCNAFWNGSSINFYAEGGGCYSMALIRDVVYHEYGHGINDLYYQFAGSGFGLNNGAMHEGYADVWGYIITQDPVLAKGYMIGDTTSFIRRYDINKKVYPADLVGQVHADGEIIAGAWYDLAVDHFGSFAKMARLWTATYDQVIDGTNGNEGQIFTDILVAALVIDDDPSNGGDGNINNGTPNLNAILTAFADHGITLISDAVVDHTALTSAVPSTGITIDAEVTLTNTWALNQVSLFYKVNNGPFTSVAMSNTANNDYTATIPGQPEGTVIGYYIAVEDNNGNKAGVTPFSADKADPNLPHYILVGVTPKIVEDFDGNGAIWTYGAVDDNATTGQWTEDIPLGTPDGNGGFVQPDDQVTPGGLACAFTQNGTVGGGIGEADVDAGKTTMFSPVWDLSNLDQPVIAYYRWYINNPPTGANPNADWFQVAISNDGGNSWVDVEDTKTSDGRYRRNAFRVQDYVSPTTTVQMRFVASDSLRAGQNLNGGSLVEAAMDDLIIYERTFVGIEEGMASMIQMYPNPAVGSVHIDLTSTEKGPFTVDIINVQGQVVRTMTTEVAPGTSFIQVDLKGLAAGLYSVRMELAGEVYTESLSVQQ